MRARLSSGPALGALLIVLGVAVFALAVSGSFRKIWHQPSMREVTARFFTTQQVAVGDEVRMAGVKVGEVKDMRLDEGARSATVTLGVKTSAGPIYRDARATARWRTLLGGAFVITLDRGTPGTGELGDSTIPTSRTENQVELDDITTVTRGAARRGLKTLPRAIAAGMASRQDPARGLRLLTTVAPDATSAIHALRGERLDTDLHDLLTAANETVRAIDRPNDRLRALVSGAAATLQATAAERGDIAQTITTAPGVLRRTRTTLSAIDTTLRVTDPLVSSLSTSAPDVAPTLAELRPVLTQASRLLDGARPLLHELRPAVASTARTADIGVPLLDDLMPSIERLHTKILPYLLKRDPSTKLRLAEAIGPTFAQLGPGSSGTTDNNGHVIHFPGGTGSSSLYLPCQIYAGNPDASKLAECKSLQTTVDDVLSFVTNPARPAPGTEPPPAPAARKAGR